MGAVASRVVRVRLRVWAAIAVLLLAAAAGGWFWLRDSSLVRVEEVTITGLSGAESDAVERTLEQTAREMTTLHVDVERLRRAVAVYPQVKDLSVTADPLHKLRIDVIERPPVALLTVGDQRTPIAADGTLLRGRVSSAGLPVVKAQAPPAGGRVSDEQTVRELAIVAAAPAPMRRHVERVEHGEDGFVAVLRDGPRVMLGDDGRAQAKWVAAARVLSDESSQGAGYIDVRLPERPAAGGFVSEIDDGTGEVSTSTSG